MPQQKIQVGFVPLMTDLYNRLVPDLRGKLDTFVREIGKGLSDEKIDFKIVPVCCTSDEIEKSCTMLEQSGAELLIAGLVSYAPSGQIISPLLKTKLPILIWPAQPMLELDPQKYNFDTVLLNHGVHGAQDLANVLRKHGRAFGIMHGHYKQPNFKIQLLEWAQAARLLMGMKKSNPVIVGGHFEDMLDLQIGSSKFLKLFGAAVHEISLDDLSHAVKSISDQQVKATLENYRLSYLIDQSVSDSLLEKSVRNELAMRKLLDERHSHAVGINFMSLCNNPEIGDALHLAACSLMADGFGYAGEGDWVTAMLVRGMMTAGYEASFSEMFSVGYKDNRLVLRHWGEGNPKLARNKPILRASAFQDQQKAEFVIMDFEFASGPTTLVNINADPHGEGQFIVVPGHIENDHLPAVDGPRAVFKTVVKDVREILTKYDYNGGSHHLVLTRGSCAGMIEKATKLVNWNFLELVW